MADPPRLHDLRHTNGVPETWDGAAWVPLARSGPGVRARGPQPPGWSWLHALAPLAVLSAIALSAAGIVSALVATAVIIAVVAVVLGAMLLAYARRVEAERRSTEDGSS